MSFHVGQFVACVDTGDHPEWIPDGSVIGDLDGLSKGIVYTVREIDVLAWDDTTDNIRLWEIVRPTKLGIVDTPYDARRFRPVDETRLAIFRQALIPVPKKEPVS